MIFKKSAVAFIVAVTVMLGGCHKNEEATDEKLSADSIVRVRDQAGDFSMPSKLWDLLLPTDKVTANKYKQENDEEMMGSSVLFAPLTVILEEKTPGVLTEPKVRIEFPKGGGQIDLARWVSGKVGSFFVKFEADGLGDPTTARVYYLSKARKRRIDEKVVGGGCKSYFDITKYMLKLKGTKGVVVNTTRNLDATTLGGHFLFSWQRDGVYFVTQANFTDSAHPTLFCNSQEETQ